MSLINTSFFVTVSVSVFFLRDFLIICTYIYDNNHEDCAYFISFHILLNIRKQSRIQLFYSVFTYTHFRLKNTIIINKFQRFYQFNIVYFKIIILILTMTCLLTIDYLIIVDCSFNNTTTKQQFLTFDSFSLFHICYVKGK